MLPLYYHNNTIVYGILMVFIWYLYGIYMVFTSEEERTNNEGKYKE